MAELLNILDRQTDLVTQINYRGSGLLYEWQNKSTKKTYEWGQQEKEKYLWGYILAQYALQYI